MKKICTFFVIVFMLFTAAGSFAYEVTDTFGRTVSFDNPPNRIVIAGRALLMVADAVYMFPEASGKIQALEKITQGAKNFIPEVDPAYDRKTVLPVDVGAEGIAAVKPDLVLMKSYMRNKLGKPLENIGIPVFYLNFENPEDYLREVEMLGFILDSKSRAREIIRFYESRLNDVENKVSDLPAAGKPSVLFLSYTRKGGSVSFDVPPRSWLQSVLIGRAGGKPVWSSGRAQGGWQKTGFEQIAAWNPDYIFITSYFSDVDEVIRSLKTDPLWTSLKAVQTDRLLGFPADYFSWDQPDTRWILGFQWLAKQMHPRLFPDLDIREEHRRFYSKLYGMNEQRVERLVQPLLRGDID